MGRVTNPRRHLDLAAAGCLSTEETAEALGLSRNNIRRSMRRYGYEAVDFGNFIGFRREDVEAAARLNAKPVGVSRVKRLKHKAGKGIQVTGSRKKGFGPSKPGGVTPEMYETAYFLWMCERGDMRELMDELGVESYRQYVAVIGAHEKGS